MKKICIIQSGCMNESQKYHQIINSALESGRYVIERDFHEADWLIVPMCSCSDHMIKHGITDLRFYVDQIKKTCKIILTGCITYINQEKWDRTQLSNIENCYIVPMENLVEDVCSILEIPVSTNIFNAYEFIAGITIGEGCLNQCSFCKVHYSSKRKQLISKPMEEILEQVNYLVSRGSKIIKFDALNTAQYGIDLYGEKKLHELIQKVTKIKGLEGLIVIAISLSDMYDELLKEIKENNLVLQVAIDIQSGSDKILKAMNVGHTVEDIRRVFHEIGFKIYTSQIISGFPGEDEYDIVKTAMLLDEIHLKNLVVDSFRTSPDIPAGKLNQLSEKDANMHYEIYTNMIAKHVLEEHIKSLQGKALEAYVISISSEKIELYTKGEAILFAKMKKEYQNLRIGSKVTFYLIGNSTKILDILEEGDLAKVELENNETIVQFINNQINGSSYFCSCYEDILERAYEMFPERFKSGKFHIY